MIAHKYGSLPDCCVTLHGNLIFMTPIADLQLTESCACVFLRPSIGIVYSGANDKKSILTVDSPGRKKNQ